MRWSSIGAAKAMLMACGGGQSEMHATKEKIDLVQSGSAVRRSGGAANFSRSATRRAVDRCDGDAPRDCLLYTSDAADE